MVLLILATFTHVSAVCWVQLVQTGYIWFIFFSSSLWISLSHGVGRGKKWQTQPCKCFKVPSCIMFINTPWNKASHIAETWLEIWSLLSTCGSVGKESVCSAWAQKTQVWSLGSGRSPGGGNGNPLQYSCRENPHRQRSLAGYSPKCCRVRHDWATKQELHL